MVAIGDVKHTVQVSSDVGHKCEHCDESVGASRDSGNIASSINHYIQQHGYRLLHVGTLTTENDRGDTWHTTVAVLGHDKRPQPKGGQPDVLGEWIG